MPIKNRPHPTDGLILREIGDWQELKELLLRKMPPRPWEERVDRYLVEDIENALHLGFRVSLRDSEKEYDERIKFYFEWADGFNSYNIELSESSEHRKEVVLRLRRKAWKMLVHNVLREPEKEHYGKPAWLYLIAREETLDLVLDFFEREGNWPDSYRSREYPEDKIGLDFLRRFARFALTFRYFGKYAGNDDYKLQQMYAKRRSRIFRLLERLHDLEFLFDRDVALDEADFEILKTMALSTERQRDNYSKPPKYCETLQEAYGRGSRAAKIAILLRVKLDEKARIRALEEAEAQKREAVRRQKEIEAAAKEAAKAQDRLRALQSQRS